ncbi:MAG: pantoate--beta-alanine ligase [Desulfuromonadaceae bacterium]|nr:pantoate--beta-alanine ligase [Desulfuromonadaceae bacterium]MDD2848433.1 pantoate--beta-alanine ligase [Desulfuromonadaceae bacterium]MDD4129938.1 pantoate--beta-alanine ligase [Desulfuromonadaceae bacterium]
MKIINSIVHMQALAIAPERAGRRIAFVPTMGYLHEGHVSLLREGRKRGDVLVLSIFVNPIQFGKNEDLDSYPRDMERDFKIADECGVDIVFIPTAEEMYPDGFQTGVTVRDVAKPLCGASRPGHFDGVATVVTKLFNIVRPDVALFGCKDYQQLAVIRRMTADLNVPVEIVGMPIIREADGLAMSSRNSYLSPAERQSALCLSRAIKLARELFAGGERSVAVLEAQTRAVIGQESAVMIEYVELRNGTTLHEEEVADNSTLLAVAVKIGQTRLIDNTVLGEEL